MTARVVGLALGASVLLLAGCGTATPIPPGLTDDEAKAIVAQRLGASRFDNDRPPIDVVEFATMDSWSSMQVTGLRAAGINAEEISGGYAVRGDGDTSEYFEKAQFTCDSQYPVDPRTQGYLSDAQADYAYDYLTERVTPCLELLGYPVVPSAPDHASFVNALPAALWTPYLSITATPAEWAAINAKCPPISTDEFALFQPPATE